jgi:hypothetical protein
LAFLRVKHHDSGDCRGLHPIGASPLVYLCHQACQLRFRKNAGLS